MKGKRQLTPEQIAVIVPVLKMRLMHRPNGLAAYRDPSDNDSVIAAQFNTTKSTIASLRIKLGFKFYTRPKTQSRPNTEVNEVLPFSMHPATEPSQPTPAMSETSKPSTRLANIEALLVEINTKVQHLYDQLA